MDRRMKPLILLLLVSLLCLTVEVTQIAEIERKNTQQTPTETTVSPTALFLYAEDGLWGIRTGSGRVILKPAWFYLRMMSKEALIAKKTGGLYGIIDYDGNTVVPFVYSDMISVSGTNLWIAELTDSDRTQYHLYRSNGTRWMNAAWDECSYNNENGVLSLKDANGSYQAVVQDNQIRYTDWHTVHSIGLHQLNMNLNAAQLAHVSDAETIQHLGDTAAYYLSYLFINQKDPPDASLLSAADSSALILSHRYRGCTLRSANVTRIKPVESEGFPSYLVQMQVSYLRTSSSVDSGSGSTEDTELINTSMQLTISVNANGTYVYSSFYDPMNV